MNHKQKIQLARKLRTPAEEKERKPLFLYRLGALDQRQYVELSPLSPLDYLHRRFIIVGACYTKPYIMEYYVKRTEYK